MKDTYPSRVNLPVVAPIIAEQIETIRQEQSANMFDWLDVCNRAMQLEFHELCRWLTSGNGENGNYGRGVMFGFDSRVSSVLGLSDGVDVSVDVSVDTDISKDGV